MKKFDYDLLPIDGMALLTAPEIDGCSPMYLADFRDTQALKYKPTGHYIGFSSGLGLRLCTGPLRMINGLWVVKDDPKVNQKHVHVALTADLLDFIPV